MGWSDLLPLQGLFLHSPCVGLPLVDSLRRKAGHAEPVDDALGCSWNKTASRQCQGLKQQKKAEEVL